MLHCSTVSCSAYCLVVNRSKDQLEAALKLVAPGENFHSIAEQVIIIMTERYLRSLTFVYNANYRFDKKGKLIVNYVQNVTSFSTRCRIRFTDSVFIR